MKVIGQMRMNLMFLNHKKEFIVIIILLLLLPLALQPTVGFGLSNNVLPFFFYLPPTLSIFFRPSSFNLSSFFLCSTFVTISSFAGWGC